MASPALRPFGQGRGKNQTTAQNFYQTAAQTSHFTQQTGSLKPVERIFIHGQNFIFFDQTSSNAFRLKENIFITKEQKCLVDHLFVAHAKNDRKYFVSCLNVLTEMFSAQKERFKFYVVVQEKIPGIFHTWTEVINSIQGIPNPLFKGFHNISEAHDYARQSIGHNYFYSPSLPPEIPLPSVPDQPEPVCENCDILNKIVAKQITENMDLKMKNRKLENKIFDLENKLFILKNKDSCQTASYSEKSSPLMGVYSPMNTKEATDEAGSSAPKAQTVPIGDSSNPLKAVALPKSQDIPSFSLFQDSQDQTCPEKTPKEIIESAESLLEKINHEDRPKRDEIKKMIRDICSEIIKEKMETSSHTEEDDVQKWPRITIDCQCAHDDDDDDTQDAVQYSD